MCWLEGTKGGMSKESALGHSLARLPLKLELPWAQFLQILLTASAPNIASKGVPDYLLLVAFSSKRWGEKKEYSKLTEKIL